MTNINSHFNYSNNDTNTSDFSVSNKVFAVDGNRKGVYVSTLKLTNTALNKDKDTDNGSLTIIYRQPTAQCENGKYTISAYAPDDISTFSKALDKMVKSKDLQEASTTAPWKKEFNDGGHIFQFNDTDPDIVITKLQNENVLSDDQINAAKNIAAKLAKIKDNPSIELDGNNL